jgi:hypothetical protein
MDTEDCVFPFSYNGKTYTSCAEKDKKYPWCSLSSKFKGAWKYCNGKNRAVRLKYSLP